MVLNVRSLDVKCRKKHLISCLLYTRSCSWLSCVSVMETSDSQTFHYFLKKVFLTFNTVVCRMHSAFSVRLIFALVSYQQTTEQLLPSSSDFRFYPESDPATDIKIYNNDQFGRSVSQRAVSSCLLTLV